MHKYIKIGQIHIDLTYQYEDYFSDIINAYETKKLNQPYYKMTIITRDVLQKPNRPITFTYKNRFKMVSDIDTYIVTMSDDIIKHMIYYTNDFKTIKIFLNDKIGKRLSEFEYVLSGMLFFEIALKESYLPIHASCIHYDNHTFLLSGPSKSGKSTQTNFFLSLFGDAKIINEDKPLIYIKENMPYVIGSPWSGKNVINENIEKPLDYLFFIHQAKEIQIKNLSREEKIKNIFKNIHRPGDEDLVDQMMSVISKIINNFSIYQFDCIKHKKSSLKLLEFMEENK